MKEKANFEAPFVALILILAGTLSPSNGVDDASYKAPSELIGLMVKVLVMSIAVYLLWISVEDQRRNTERKPPAKHLKTLSFPKFVEAIMRRNR